MELVELLENENRCLKKFLNLIEIQLRDIDSGRSIDWSQFEKKRHTLFKTLQLFSQRINVTCHDLLNGVSSPALQCRLNEARKTIQQQVAQKHRLIQLILKKNQALIAQIQQEQKLLLAELSLSNKSIHMVSKFRSGWISESGENLDGRL